MTKAAVIVRAGRNSTHAAWLSGAPAEFDLIVAAYQDLPPQLRQGASNYVLIPGNKVQGWSDILRLHPQLLDDYDHLALIDDDIVCSAADINKSFALGREYGLSLWQPSLSWNSHFSYGVCLYNPYFQLRYVNFVEMMSPFFSAAHLRACLPLLGMGLETGIDRLWCRMRADWREAYAVLDAVQVFHSRPVGSKKADQGFEEDYQRTIDAMEQQLNLWFRGPVAYAGITRSGRKVSGRWRMAYHALAQLRAARVSPNVKEKWFFRPVTDHVRHNLLRPIDNEPASALADLPRRA